MKTRFTVSAAVALLLNAATIYAQQTPDSIKNVALDQVVVTGTGHHQRLWSTPIPVSVVDPQKIEQVSGCDITNTLVRSLPQLSFAPSSMGDYLRLNGMGNRYALILVNGKRLIGDISGNVSLRRIGMGQIKRIEVVDGAASSLYGSDAIAGVVNIITSSNKVENSSFSSTTRVSGEGQFREGAVLNLKFGKFASKTVFSHSRADYFSHNNYKEATDGTLTEVIPCLTVGHRANVVSQRFTVTPTKNLNIFAEGTYDWHKTDRPDTDDELSGGYDYEIRSEGWRYDAGVNVNVGERRHRLTVRATGDKTGYGYEYKFATGSYEKGDYNRRKTQKLTDIEVKALLKIVEGATTIAGVDWKRDALDAVSGNVDEDVYTWAVYAQHEQNIVDELKGMVGVRVTKNENFGTNVTPRVALLYSPANWTFRAAYSRGFRAPGLDEMYYRYFTFSHNYSTITIGDPDLDPETSDFFSVSAGYHSRAWHLSATGFVNNIKDMIVRITYELDEASLADLREEFPEITDEQAEATTHYNKYTNADKGRVYGVSAEGGFVLPMGLNFNANWAYLNAREKTEGEWQDLERSIRNTFTTTVGYTRSWGLYTLNVSVSGRYQSRTHYNSPYEYAPAFSTWNLQTQHTFSFAHLVLTPQVGVDNIFDEIDSRPSATNRKFSNYSAGRMVTAGLKLQVR